MTRYEPEVLLDHNARPLLVFAKGRVLFHAIEATDSTIRLQQLATLRGLRPALLRGDPYPVKRAASFWLNRTDREITTRAKAVLRGLVARKPMGQS